MRHQGLLRKRARRSPGDQSSGENSVACGKKRELPENRRVGHLGWLLGCWVWAFAGCSDRVPAEESQGDVSDEANVSPDVNAAGEECDEDDVSPVVPETKDECESIGWNWIEDLIGSPPIPDPPPARIASFCAKTCVTDADCAGTGLPSCHARGLFMGGDCDCNGSVMVCRPCGAR